MCDVCVTWPVKPVDRPTVQLMLSTKANNDGQNTLPDLQGMVAF